MIGSCTFPSEVALFEMNCVCCVLVTFLQLCERSPEVVFEAFVQIIKINSLIVTITEIMPVYNSITFTEN